MPIQLVLYADCLHVHFIYLSRSLTKILNRAGPELWVPPFVTGCQLDGAHPRCLVLAIQPDLYLKHSALIHVMISHFLCENAVENGIKGFTKVQAKNIHFHHLSKHTTYSLMVGCFCQIVANLQQKCGKLRK